MYDRLWDVPDPPPVLAQAAAQIHVFHVHEYRLIEAGDRLEGSPADKEGRSRDPVWSTLGRASRELQRWEPAAHDRKATHEQIVTNDRTQRRFEPGRYRAVCPGWVEHGGPNRCQ
jgi:hypothetical protein